jgi:putative glycosyltransferase (TIGR04372 family)
VIGKGFFYGAFIFFNLQVNQIRTGGRPILMRKFIVLWSRLLALLTILFLFIFRPLGSNQTEQLARDIHSVVWQACLLADNKSEVCRRRGVQLQSADALDQAMIFYNKAIQLSPDLPRNYFSIADGYYLTGQYLRGMEQYEHGLILNQKKAIETGLDSLKIRFLDIGFTSTIGHISHLDPFVKLMLLGRLSPYKRILVTNVIANPCYLNYWKRYLPIIILDSDQMQDFQSFAEPLLEHLSMWQLSDKFENLYACISLSEQLWSAEKRPPLLCLSDSDQARGRDALESMGVPRDAWFVCLHVRENEIRITRNGADADIHTYLMALESITTRGGWVIRMGNPSMSPLPTMSHVIDYANSRFRTDWMDVFLWASCRFFIGTASGPLSVPPTFGVPVLYTNAPALGIAISMSNSICIPKLYWSERENRILTFAEMFSSPSGWTVSSDFSRIGLKQLDNTPEEINDAVLEMFTILGGNNSMSDEDILLQENFSKIRKKFGALSNLSIASCFLRKHKILLDT